MVAGGELFLFSAAQNEPRLSAVKEPRKSVHAPDCESRSEEAKERTADDTGERDEGVREVKGRGSLEGPARGKRVDYLEAG